jgi:hypothetical protein
MLVMTRATPAVDHPRGVAGAPGAVHESGPVGVVFVGPKGCWLRQHNFRKLWLAALVDAKITKVDVHFHDLRHTGNELAAQAGASLKELMSRMGHSSTRAALIYLHATTERDHQIAKEISKRVTRARSRRASVPVVRSAVSLRGTRRARRVKRRADANGPGGGMALLTWAFALCDLRGDEGNRTPNPCLAKAVLCQLSYVPESAWGSTHAEGWRARRPARCLRPGVRPSWRLRQER